MDRRHVDVPRRGCLRRSEEEQEDPYGRGKPEMADEEPEWVDANERCGSDNVATETLADPGVAATSLEQVEHRMKHQVKELVEKELRRSRTMSDHAGLIEGRVRAARVLWTDELLRHCSTLPRPRKSDDAPYVIQRKLEIFQP